MKQQVRRKLVERLTEVTNRVIVDEQGYQGGNSHPLLFPRGKMGGERRKGERRAHIISKSRSHTTFTPQPQEHQHTAPSLSPPHHPLLVSGPHSHSCVRPQHASHLTPSRSGRLETRVSGTGGRGRTTFSLSLLQHTTSVAACLNDPYVDDTVWIQFHQTVQ